MMTTDSMAGASSVLVTCSRNDLHTHKRCVFDAICDVIHSLVSEERKCPLRCPRSVQCWPVIWGHARYSGKLTSAVTVHRHTRAFAITRRHRPIPTAELRFITARAMHCKRCISYSNSVCLSVCLSVCPSVRLSVRHTPVLCQNDGT